MKTVYLSNAEIISRLNADCCITNAFISQGGGEAFGWSETDLNRFDYCYCSVNFVINRLSADLFTLDWELNFEISKRLLQGNLVEVVAEVNSFVKTVPCKIAFVNEESSDDTCMFTLVDSEGYDVTGEYVTIQDAKNTSGNNYVLEGFQEINNLNLNNVFEVLGALNNNVVMPEKRGHLLTLNYGCGCSVYLHRDFNIATPCNEHIEQI